MFCILFILLSFLGFSDGKNHVDGPRPQLDEKVARFKVLENETNQEIIKQKTNDNNLELNVLILKINQIESPQDAILPPNFFGVDVNKFPDDVKTDVRALKEKLLETILLQYIDAHLSKFNPNPPTLGLPTDIAIKIELAKQTLVSIWRKNNWPWAKGYRYSPYIAHVKKVLSKLYEPPFNPALLKDTPDTDDEFWEPFKDLGIEGFYRKDISSIKNQLAKLASYSVPGDEPIPYSMLNLLLENEVEKIKSAETLPHNSTIKFSYSLANFFEEEKELLKYQELRDGWTLQENPVEKGRFRSSGPNSRVAMPKGHSISVTHNRPPQNKTTSPLVFQTAFLEDNDKQIAEKAQENLKKYLALICQVDIQESFDGDFKDKENPTLFKNPELNKLFIEVYGRNAYNAYTRIPSARDAKSTQGVEAFDWVKDNLFKYLQSEFQRSIERTKNLIAFQVPDQKNALAKFLSLIPRDSLYFLNSLKPEGYPKPYSELVEKLIYDQAAKHPYRSVDLTKYTPPIPNVDYCNDKFIPKLNNNETLRTFFNYSDLPICKKLEYYQKVHRVLPPKDKSDYNFCSDINEYQKLEKEIKERVKKLSQYSHLPATIRSDKPEIRLPNLGDEDTSLIHAFNLLTFYNDTEGPDKHKVHSARRYYKKIDSHMEDSPNGWLNSERMVCHNEYMFYDLDPKDPKKKVLNPMCAKFIKENFYLWLDTIGKRARDYNKCEIIQLIADLNQLGVKNACESSLDRKIIEDFILQGVPEMAGIRARAQVPGKPGEVEGFPNESRVFLKHLVFDTPASDSKFQKINWGEVTKNFLSLIKDSYPPPRLFFQHSQARYDVFRNEEDKDHYPTHELVKDYYRARVFAAEQCKNPIGASKQLIKMAQRPEESKKLEIAIINSEQFHNKMINFLEKLETNGPPHSKQQRAEKRLDDIHFYLQGWLQNELKTEKKRRVIDPDTKEEKLVTETDFSPVNMPYEKFKRRILEGGDEYRHKEKLVDLIKSLPEREGFLKALYDYHVTFFRNFPGSRRPLSFSEVFDHEGLQYYSELSVMGLSACNPKKYGLKVYPDKRMIPNDKWSETFMLDDFLDGTGKVDKIKDSRKGINQYFLALDNNILALETAAKILSDPATTNAEALALLTIDPEFWKLFGKTPPGLEKLKEAAKLNPQAPFLMGFSPFPNNNPLVNIGINVFGKNPYLAIIEDLIKEFKDLRKRKNEEIESKVNGNPIHNTRDIVSMFKVSPTQLLTGAATQSEVEKNIQEARKTFDLLFNPKALTFKTASDTFPLHFIRENFPNGIRIANELAGIKDWHDADPDSAESIEGGLRLKLLYGYVRYLKSKNPILLQEFIEDQAKKNKNVTDLEKALIATVKSFPSELEAFEKNEEIAQLKKDAPEVYNVLKQTFLSEKAAQHSKLKTELDTAHENATRTNENIRKLVTQNYCFPTKEYKSDISDRFDLTLNNFSVNHSLGVYPPDTLSKNQSQDLYKNLSHGVEYQSEIIYRLMDSTSLTFRRNPRPGIDPRKIDKERGGGMLYNLADSDIFYLIENDPEFKNSASSDFFKTNFPELVPLTRATMENIQRLRTINTKFLKGGDSQLIELWDAYRSRIEHKPFLPYLGTLEILGHDKGLAIDKTDRLVGSTIFNKKTFKVNPTAILPFVKNDPTFDIKVETPEVAFAGRPALDIFAKKLEALKIHEGKTPSEVQIRETLAYYQACKKFFEKQVLLETTAKNTQSKFELARDSFKFMDALILNTFFPWRKIPYPPSKGLFEKEEYAFMKELQAKAMLSERYSVSLAPKKGVSANLEFMEPYLLYEKEVKNTGYFDAAKFFGTKNFTNSLEKILKTQSLRNDLLKFVELLPPGDSFKNHVVKALFPPWARSLLSDPGAAMEFDKILRFKPYDLCAALWAMGLDESNFKGPDRTEKINLALAEMRKKVLARLPAVTESAGKNGTRLERSLLPNNDLVDIDADDFSKIIGDVLQSRLNLLKATKINKQVSELMPEMPDITQEFKYARDKYQALAKNLPETRKKLIDLQLALRKAHLEEPLTGDSMRELLKKHLGNLFLDETKSLIDTQYEALDEILTKTIADIDEMHDKGLNVKTRVGAKEKTAKPGIKDSECNFNSNQLAKKVEDRPKLKNSVELYNHFLNNCQDSQTRIFEKNAPFNEKSNFIDGAAEFVNRNLTDGKKYHFPKIYDSVGATYGTLKDESINALSQLSDNSLDALNFIISANIMVGFEPAEKIQKNGAFLNGIPDTCEIVSKSDLERNKSDRYRFYSNVHINPVDFSIVSLTGAPFKEENNQFFIDTTPFDKLLHYNSSAGVFRKEAVVTNRKEIKDANGNPTGKYFADNSKAPAVLSKSQIADLLINPDSPITTIFKNQSLRESYFNFQLRTLEVDSPAYGLPLAKPKPPSETLIKRQIAMGKVFGLNEFAGINGIKKFLSKDFVSITETNPKRTQEIITNIQNAFSNPLLTDNDKNLLSIIYGYLRNIGVTPDFSCEGRLARHYDLEKTKREIAGLPPVYSPQAAPIPRVKNVPSVVQAPAPVTTPPEPASKKPLLNRLLDSTKKLVAEVKNQLWRTPTPKTPLEPYKNPFDEKSDEQHERKNLIAELRKLTESLDTKKVKPPLISKEIEYLINKIPHRKFDENIKKKMEELIKQLEEIPKLDPSKRPIALGILLDNLKQLSEPPVKLIGAQQEILDFDFLFRKTARSAMNPLLSNKAFSEELEKLKSILPNSEVDGSPAGRAKQLEAWISKAQKNPEYLEDAFSKHFWETDPDAKNLAWIKPYHGLQNELKRSAHQQVNHANAFYFAPNWEKKIEAENPETGEKLIDIGTLKNLKELHTIMCRDFLKIDPTADSCSLFQKIVSDLDPKEIADIYNTFAPYQTFYKNLYGDVDELEVKVKKLFKDDPYTFFEDLYVPDPSKPLGESKTKAFSDRARHLLLKEQKRIIERFNTLKRTGQKKDDKETLAQDLKEVIALTKLLEHEQNFATLLQVARKYYLDPAEDMKKFGKDDRKDFLALIEKDLSFLPQGGPEHKKLSGFYELVKNDPEAQAAIVKMFNLDNHFQVENLTEELSKLDSSSLKQIRETGNPMSEAITRDLPGSIYKLNKSFHEQIKRQELIGQKLGYVKGYHSNNIEEAALRAEAKKQECEGIEPEKLANIKWKSYQKGYEKENLIGLKEMADKAWEKWDDYQKAYEKNAKTLLECLAEPIPVNGQNWNLLPFFDQKIRAEQDLQYKKAALYRDIGHTRIRLTQLDQGLKTVNEDLRFLNTPLGKEGDHGTNTLYGLKNSGRASPELIGVIEKRKQEDEPKREEERKRLLLLKNEIITSIQNEESRFAKLAQAHEAAKKDFEALQEEWELKYDDRVKECKVQIATANAIESPEFIERLLLANNIPRESLYYLRDQIQKHFDLRTQSQSLAEMLAFKGVSESEVQKQPEYKAWAAKVDDSCLASKMKENFFSEYKAKVLHKKEYEEKLARIAQKLKKFDIKMNGFNVDMTDAKFYLGSKGELRQVLDEASKELNEIATKYSDIPQLLEMGFVPPTDLYKQMKKNVLDTWLLSGVTTTGHISVANYHYNAFKVKPNNSGSVMDFDLEFENLAILQSKANALAQKLHKEISDHSEIYADYRKAADRNMLYSFWHAADIKEKEQVKTAHDAKVVKYLDELKKLGNFAVSFDDYGVLTPEFLAYQVEAQNKYKFLLDKENLLIDAAKDSNGRFNELMFEAITLLIPTTKLGTLGNRLIHFAKTAEKGSNLARVAKYTGKTFNWAMQTGKQAIEFQNAAKLFNSAGHGAQFNDGHYTETTLMFGAMSPFGKVLGIGGRMVAQAAPKLQKIPAFVTKGVNGFAAMTLATTFSRVANKKFLRGSEQSSFDIAKHGFVNDLVMGLLAINPLAQFTRLNTKLPFTSKKIFDNKAFPTAMGPVHLLIFDILTHDKAFGSAERAKEIADKKEALAKKLLKKKKIEQNGGSATEEELRKAPEPSIKEIEEAVAKMGEIGTHEWWEFTKEKIEENAFMYSHSAFGAGKHANATRAQIDASYIGKKLTEGLASRFNVKPGTWGEGKEHQHVTREMFRNKYKTEGDSILEMSLAAMSKDEFTKAMRDRPGFLEEVAKFFNVTTETLRRAFSRMADPTFLKEFLLRLGINPEEFFLAFRKAIEKIPIEGEEAKQLLKDNPALINEVIRELKLTPEEWKELLFAMEVKFARFDSLLFSAKKLYGENVTEKELAEFLSQPEKLAKILEHANVSQKDWNAKLLEAILKGKNKAGATIIGSDRLGKAATESFLKKTNFQEIIDFIGKLRNGTRLDEMLEAIFKLDPNLKGEEKENKLKELRKKWEEAKKAAINETPNKFWSAVLGSHEMGENFGKIRKYIAIDLYERFKVNHGDNALKEIGEFEEMKGELNKYDKEYEWLNKELEELKKEEKRLNDEFDKKGQEKFSKYVTDKAKWEEIIDGMNKEADKIESLPDGQVKNRRVTEFNKKLKRLSDEYAVWIKENQNIEQRIKNEINTEMKTEIDKWNERVEAYNKRDKEYSDFAKKFNAQQEKTKDARNLFVELKNAGFSNLADYIHPKNYKDMPKNKEALAKKLLNEAVEKGETTKEKASTSAAVEEKVKQMETFGTPEYWAYEKAKTEFENNEKYSLDMKILRAIHSSYIDQARKEMPYPGWYIVKDFESFKEYVAENAAKFENFDKLCASYLKWFKKKMGPAVYKPKGILPDQAMLDLEENFGPVQYSGPSDRTPGLFPRLSKGRGATPKEYKGYDPDFEWGPIEDLQESPKLPEVPENFKGRVVARPYTRVGGETSRWGVLPDGSFKLKIGPIKEPKPFSVNPFDK